MKSNTLYKGDCYSVLKRKFETGNKNNGVDLIYLDPPFSFDPKYARIWYDKDTYEMFDDMRKGGVMHFVDWMRKRLEQCHRVMKNTGSIYLHCDWKFVHYLKVEMDNIFGINNFQNDIIWNYSIGGRSNKRWGRKHDNILYYTKSKKWTFNDKDIRVDYTPHKGSKDKKNYGGKMGVDENGRPYVEKWGTGKKKKYRYYLDEGKIPEDVWTDIQALQPAAKERTGYLTQKPMDLLERIIKASSNEGDIVMDPFCGCGTTVATAQKNNRNWIGVDISKNAIEIIKNRMEGLGEKVEIDGIPLNIEDMKNLPPFDFEDYICHMTDSIPTKHTGDGGIDGYLKGETPIQIKQSEKVGRKVVDEFETAIRRRRKNKGHIIAFSYTKGSHEEAARAKKDGLEIKLNTVRNLMLNDFVLG